MSLCFFPGAVSPANSTASGPGVGTLSSPQSVQAGVQSTFSLFPKDYYGNAVLDSSLNFRVKLTLNGSQPTALNSDHVTFVTDHYEVGYTPIRAGNYSVSVVKSLRQSLRSCFLTLILFNKLLERVRQLRSFRCFTSDLAY